MDKSIIQTDFENANRYKIEVNGDIGQWLSEYDGEPYGNEMEGRSKIVWKLIKKHGEILVANLSKPLITGSNLINLEPRTKYDVFKANVDKKLINFFFNKDFNKVNFIKTLSKVMVKEGTAIIKVSWEKTKRTNRPFAEILFNEDFFTDPDAISIKDCKFIIHRFRTTYEDLEENPIYDNKAIQKFKQAQIQEDDDGEIDAMAVGSDLHNRDLTGYSREEDNELFLYEYWYKDKGKIKIVSYLNSYKSTNILSEEEYEYDWYPFIAIPFYDNEFKIWGRGLADIISDEQKFMTSIVRGVIDNMSMSNNGTKFVKKGALDSINFKNLMEGKPVVEVNATDNISNVVRDGSFNELPSMVYNLLQVIEAQAEGLTGVSKMMQGLENINNSSATASQLVMTQSQIRLLDIENNIAQGLKELIHRWLEMIMDYVTEDQMYQITGTTFAEEKAKMTEKLKQQYQLEQMPQDTAQKAMMLIINEVEKVFDKHTVKYDISIQIGTDGLKQTKINQINMLMQQSSALVQTGAVPPVVIQKLMAKLFELFDYPGLAEEIANFKQQPDPMQQQMMQLELQEKAAKTKKESALADNALARTKQTMVKAQKEQMSTDADISAKYANVAKTMKEVNSNDNNKKG